MAQLNQKLIKQLRSLELENRVVRHLDSQNFPIFRDLSVTAELGRVTISGRVSSFYERQIAVSSVRQLAGVVKLTDQIVVDTPA